MNKNRIIKAAALVVAFLCVIFSAIIVYGSTCSHSLVETVYSIDGNIQFGQHRAVKKCTLCGITIANSHEGHSYINYPTDDMYCYNKICAKCEYKDFCTHFFNAKSTGSNMDSHFDSQTCAWCGFEKRSNILNHVWGEEKVEQDNKSWASGYKHDIVQYCTVCDYRKVVRSEGHDFTWEVLRTGATATTHQVKYNCKICGYNYISNEAHVDTSTSFISSKNEGKHTKQISCSDCSKILSSTEESCPSKSESISNSILGGDIYGFNDGANDNNHYHYLGCPLCKRYYPNAQKIGIKTIYVPNEKDLKKHIKVFCCSLSGKGYDCGKSVRMESIPHVWNHYRDDTCVVCNFQHQKHLITDANVADKFFQRMPVQSIF